jgi:hypothetical protein
MEVYLIDLSRDICKLVLKLDFTAQALGGGGGGGSKGRTTSLMDVLHKGVRRNM